MLPSPLVLDSSRLQHRPLELVRLVDGLREVPTPTNDNGQCRCPLVVAQGCAKAPGVDTHLATFPTSVSIFHRSLRESRYSIAARSRASITPSLSEALAFHILTFPSSDPDNTNLASAVNAVENTLPSHCVDVSGQGGIKGRAVKPHRCIRLVWYTSGCFPTPSFQIRTVRSQPPLTNSVPVGLQSQLITAATCALYICVGEARCRISNV